MVNNYDSSTDQPAALTAGTDFTILYTALKNYAPGEALPEEIPPEQLFDLSDYDIRVQLSTTPVGYRFVATTETGSDGFEIRRHDRSRLSIHIPGKISNLFSEGELILTVEALQRSNGTVAKAETILVPVIKTKNIAI